MTSHIMTRAERMCLHNAARGCGDACPLLPGKLYEDWELDGPAGKTLKEIRPIRDEIRDRVTSLIEKLATA